MRTFATAPLLAAFLFGASSTFAGVDGFVESPLQQGVWARSKPGMATEKTPNPALATTAAHAIPGFISPGAIVRDGTTLYVGEDTPIVRVVDASIPGAEFVVNSITTPVAPIDLLVKNGTLYVINQNRDALWRKTLPSGAWQSLALSGPNISEWDYGNILIPHPTLNKAFVLHFWENKIDVVNLATWQLETTITKLHHLPDRIAFNSAGTRMAVLCVGLSAPSCLASGPNLAVFDLGTLVKQYEVNLQGDCSLELATHFNDAYVVRNADLRRFDLTAGALIAQKTGDFFGRNGVSNGRELVLQDSAGEALRFDFELIRKEDQITLMQQSQIWYPPVEEMVAFSPCDGRVFVTNRNDQTVSVIESPQGFANYAVGCPGSGGFIPDLLGAGCPSPGGAVIVALTDALGNAPTFLFLGAATNDLPLGGTCTFLIDPVSAPWLSLPAPGFGPGGGSWQLATTMPSILPTGVVVTAQVAVLDAGAPLGYCVSNGMRFMFE